MEYIVKTDDRPEVDQITSFIKSLKDEDRRALLMFIRGFQSAQDQKTA